jgi:hypothetical protein
MNLPISTLAERALESAGLSVYGHGSLSTTAVKIINKVYRAADESHLWPVSGRFNATERAIKRVRINGYQESAAEYIAAMDAELTSIVNEG